MALIGFQIYYTNESTNGKMFRKERNVNYDPKKKKCVN